MGKYTEGQLVWGAPSYNGREQDVVQFVVKKVGRKWIHLENAAGHKLAVTSTELPNKTHFENHELGSLENTTKYWSLIQVSAGMCKLGRFIVPDMPEKQIKKIFHVKDQEEWNKFPRSLKDQELAKHDYHQWAKAHPRRARDLQRTR